MLKVGAGACRFGGIPNKGYVGKGYMSPKQCLDMCSKDKKCQGAYVNKTNCINIMNSRKQRDFVYRVISVLVNCDY